LVGRPQVAFLDEPTAGVDVGGRQVIRQIVRDLRDDGVAVVLTTHELTEAEHLADHVVIVDRGQVVAAGPLAELIAGAGEEIRFAAAPGLDVHALGDRLGATVVESSPGEYVAAVAPAPATVAALTAWLAEHDLALGDLRAGRQSLEDVFLRLTGDDA
jgi:ABC-2 type transport system ATP-binding protein